MKRAFVVSICAVLLMLATELPLRAGEVIDGVVATVNHQPVLRSDWNEAVDFEAFMQQKAVSHMTEAERGVTLRRLIDQQLLKSQMAEPHVLEPSEQRLQEDLAKLRAQLPGANDDATWQRLLADYGLNEASVKEHLRTQVLVMNFVEVRLRPDIHIQPEEVEAYYNQQLVPDLKLNGGKVIPLEEAAPRIRELLTQQRMDDMLDQWLHNLRQQAEIHSTVPLPEIGSAAKSSKTAND